MSFIKLFFILSFFYTASSWSQGHVKMGATALNIDGKNILAVSFENDKKWHTYWKNPGDAGQEIKLEFIVEGTKTKLKDFPWPAPKRYIEQGDMWAFGYSDKYALFYELPENLKNKTIKIDGKWLVCKDICIPGQGVSELQINDNLMGMSTPLIEENKLRKIFNKLPKKSKNNSVQLFLTKSPKENQLALHYIIENANFDLIDMKSNVLTPYLRPPFDYKHEEIYLDKNDNSIYGRMYVDWDGIYEDPEIPLPRDGLFDAPIEVSFLLQFPNNENAKILTHTFKEFSLKGDEVLSAKFKTLTPLNSKTKGIPETKMKQAPNSLLYYILFAFLGGLILNLMPCVLPVISLKLFGLIVHSNESKKQILKHNLAYTTGVLFSFFVLAGVVLALKTSGEQIGWGFQLQSPTFVFIMCMMIFIMSLNMLGLFEFVTPGGKTLGNAEMKKGMSADFVNGILATILSTPCSAPFLGTALTFAFTTSHFNIFLIFMFVGIGLAFPFILTGFFPKMIQFLPKPGIWMDNLKKFLGLSLLLTVAWLTDVLFSIIDFGAVGIYYIAILIMTFFAFYFRKTISKKILWNIILFLIPLILLKPFIPGLKTVANSSAVNASRVANGVEWKKWSPQVMEEKSGYKFIDFTAEWCLTCKVNKKLVLNTDDFTELAKKHAIETYVADWTKRDEAITKFLKSYGHVGVPVYFIQKPNGEIISLGETISISKIKENLK